MVANTGVSLALVPRPELNVDAAFSTILRDIVHSALVAEVAPSSDTGESDRIAAISFAERSPRAMSGELFTDREAGLLDEWL